MPSEIFYNSVAHHYDEYCNDSGINDYVDQEIALVESFSPRSIIEMGIGNGRFANPYITKHPAVRYIGVDNSKTMLMLAKETKATCVHMDITEYIQYCIETGTKTDVIIAPYSAIHHIPTLDQLELFALMKRVSGVIIINCITDAEEKSLFKAQESAVITMLLPQGKQASTTVYKVHETIRGDTVTHPESTKREYLVWHGK